MKVGHLIRAERIRQKMKQVVLARGICTPSYLSKIERNQIAPSEDIAILLFNKLNMDIDTIQEKDYKSEAEFEYFLRDTFKKVLTVRDDNFTELKLEELESKSPLFENDSLHYSYLLIVLRLRLTLGMDMVNRKKDIDNLAKLSSNFNLRHKYQFYIINAIYYYFIKNLKKSIEYLEDVLKIADEIALDNWEKAELNYLIGLVYTADGRVFNAIEHIRKALDFFRENLHMKRVLECYVLIGLTQKKSEQFVEAFESYFRAKQLCDEFGLDSQKGLVYHNLGSLYGAMGNSEEAIIHVTKSIEFKEDSGSKLTSIMALVIEFSKLNDIPLVNKWCDQGLELFNKLNKDSLMSFYHHFHFYKCLHNLEDESKDIALKAIEYFKEFQDYQHVHKYCIAMAEWYYLKRKYKLSSIFYQEANRYGYIYRKIEKWEDL
jgi:HTH-type transcriptional regulator, quorum sensing regulator NprR